MGRTLLIDANYLCHRAFHTVGELTFGDIGTGVAFGVLRSIVYMVDHLQAKRCIFCFDGSDGVRFQMFSQYKAGRRRPDMTDEERERRAEFYRQVDILGREILPAAGFCNVYRRRGYEADDLIAAIAGEWGSDGEAVIISGDHDLWQCLRGCVWYWNPTTKKSVTYCTFFREWGIKPHQWADVKALAGCNSDGIPGVVGVGEPTAAKYVRGEINPKSKTFAKIQAGMGLYRENLKLVRLPLPGTPTPPIRDDQVTPARWNDIARRLGMPKLGPPPRYAACKGWRRVAAHQTTTGETP